jgi:purine-nucleoside phosphorylase
MSGRAHLYEGYSPGRVTYAMRMMHLLGVKSVVLTNAAGGINPDYGQGALVLIADHINLQGVNPLVGANEDDFGPRFPDMSDAYSADYRQKARAAAAEVGIELREGVYAAMLGPSYETPAEIRFLRAIGADLVGMSTVAETIVCNHMGMKVLAISCVTNMAAGTLPQERTGRVPPPETGQEPADSASAGAVRCARPQKISHEEVLETGLRVRAIFVRLLRAVIPRLEGADGAPD